MAQNANGPVTATLNGDGSLTVRQDCGTNADGTVAARQWDIRPENVERHLNMTPAKIDGSGALPSISATLSPGDRSAALDLINALKKNRG